MIDEVDNPDNQENDVSKDDIKATSMGLKPILKSDMDEIVTAEDFEDPFGAVSQDELEIPRSNLDTENGDMKTPPPLSKSEVAEDIDQDKSDAIDIPNILKAPITTASPDTDTNMVSKPDNSLNLHPIDITADASAEKEPIPTETKFQNIIKSIDTVHDERPIGHDSEMTPKTHRADNFPQFMTGITTPPLDIPDFTAPKWPYWILTFIALFWILASAAAAYGYFELGLNALTANPIHALGFVGFVLIPACLLLMTALLLRRMNKLSTESQTLAFLNQQLLTPSDHAAQASARLADNITQQMDRIEQRADQAFDRLKTVQSAFSTQIEDISNTLSQSADRQTGLDANLQTSKAAWADTVRNTDDTITNLSESLDNVLASFQTRIQTTHEQIMGLGQNLTEQSQTSDAALSPILARSEQMHSALTAQMDMVSELRAEVETGLGTLDQLLETQTQKLGALRSQQADLKAETRELHSTWAEDEDQTQERLFAQLSQIDALNERTDALIKKIDKAAQNMTRATNETAALPLRGSMKEEQLSLIPGLGDAKSMLPSLLSSEPNNDPLTLAYEDIEPSDLHEPLYTPETLEPLSSQRVFGTKNTNSKSGWLKRFGRRSTDPIAPIQPSAGPLPPPHTQTQQTEYVNQAPMTLRERLIKEQLSPEALIDAGCIQRAVQIRRHDGPFAMSRYMATHLGAAADHLKSILPDNQALRTQVHDMAAAFPMREKLDGRDDDALIFILSSESGREYLLCDAALNG